VGEFVSGSEATTWYGIGAPKKTPPEIVERLNKETNAGRPPEASRETLARHLTSLAMGRGP
jgi:hypothetical protein